MRTFNRRGRRGDDPNNRCHWSFVFHDAGAEIGNLFQVLVIDLDRLCYQFDRRDGVDILNPTSEGRFEVVTIRASRYRHATAILKKEPSPWNGTDRCQDWTVNCLIALEVEEMIPPGTAQWVNELVGKSATELAHVLGCRWIPNRPES
ncbi:hypothetical protein BCR34DRAFT_211001 [Clohesyomyces aquaticus]|uniref:Uncharacterized protein n=1 Tax=Clohesyomyces aquaticus TaxID=1231657 RepID=A0A1Y1ZWX0_9PLEO|nr:hypothetical protein BCR34DRAFT_211001 [Clohesyomyces aquaticus]